MRNAMKCILDNFYQTCHQILHGHLSFLTPTVVGGRRPFGLKFVLKVTHPHVLEHMVSLPQPSYLL